MTRYSFLAHIRTGRGRLSLAVILSLVGLVSGGLTSPGHADVEVASKRAQVRDLEKGNYFWASSGISTAKMASTTKIMSMHLALQAVRNNDLELDDTLVISDLAAQQNCNCFGGSDGILQGGDSMTVEDALYSVSMSNNDVTGALGELVANAVLHNTKATGGTNQTTSGQLTEEFVEMMNDEADALNLDDTVFTNPQGWDTGDHHSTTADLIDLWVQARKDSRFITFMKCRDRTVTYFDDSANQTKTVFYDKNFTYYPGVVADKNGITTLCIFCWVAEARRLGRAQVAAILQAPTFNDALADLTELFRHGYEQAFYPRRRGDSGGQAGAMTQGAIDCTGTTRCATAVKFGDKKLKLITWQVDPKTGKITRKTSATATAAGRITDIDIAYPGFVGSKTHKNRVVVVLAQTLLGPQLLSFAVNTNEPPKLVEKVGAGVGTAAAIEKINSGMVALGYRSGAEASKGMLLVKTYDVAANGKLDLLDKSVPLSKPRFDIALDSIPTRTFAGTGPYRLSAAFGVTNGSAMIVYEINRESGEVVYLTNASLGGEARKVDVVATNHFPGVPTFSPQVTRFVTATNRGGPVDLQWWQLPSDGPLTLVGDAAAGTGTKTGISLARTGANGYGVFLNRTNSQGNLVPSTWEWVPSWGGDERFMRLSQNSSFAGKATEIDTARLNVTADGGVYVTAVRTGGGGLKLLMTHSGT